MSDSKYPNLGFDPAPGVVADVTSLDRQIKAAAESVKETNAMLRKIRDGNSDVWKGDAGNAFRANFDANLGQDLGYAQNSLERAVSVLGGWKTALVDYQQTAVGLEREAAAARQAHATATAALTNARSNPDLGLANVTFTDPGELQAAQSRLDAAAARVRSAVAAVDESQASIDAIVNRAKDLQSEHDRTARRAASELDGAAKDFAPRPPDKSIWDKITDAVKAVGKWIDEHRELLHTILSTTAAIAGLLALVTPPPISAIALGVSLVAGAGALTLSLTDPKIRDGLLSGDPKAWLQVGGDTLGLLPGIGGVAKVGKVALVGDGIGDVGKFESIARAWGEAAYNPGLVANALAKSDSVTSAVSSSGLLSGTHRILQWSGVAGAHAVPDPAAAIGIASRGASSVYKLGGIAAGVFDD